MSRQDESMDEESEGPQTGAEPETMRLYSKYKNMLDLCRLFYRNNKKIDAFIYMTYAIDILRRLTDIEENERLLKEYKEDLEKREKAQKEIYFFMAKELEILPNMLGLQHPLRDKLMRYVIDENDLRIRRHPEVGSSTEGKIYDCLYKGSPCAIKVYYPVKNERKATSDRYIIEDCFRSLNLRHPCIVHYYGFVQFRTPRDVNGVLCDFGIVMEKADCDLKNLIRQERLDDATKKKIALQVLQGLIYLHSHNILYSDLKPDNILVFKEANGEYRAKLCDFGLSNELKCIEGINQEFISVVGSTTQYKSPEMVNEKVKVTVKSDMFSFASFAYQLYTGHVPYTYPRQVNAEEFISRGEGPQISYPVPDPFWKTIFDKCWVKSAESRPSASELLEELISILQSSE